jgi:hypothetical protein
MNNIVLHVYPGRPALRWETFCEISSTRSIALDGFVFGGPKFQSKVEGGPRVNFNHHEEVDRLATRSTCGQVLMAIRQGLFSAFHDPKSPSQEINVYVNDCDEDVCLSFFLLKNEHLVKNTMNPILNRLVAMEDALDATAGAYPFPPELPVLEELAWVFEPYHRFRASNGLERHTPEEFKIVIDSVCSRIMRHITGSGERITIDTSYQILSSHQGWAMVKEMGAGARTGMFADGIKAYVSMRARSDGNYSYTIGRMSPFIPFDVERILKALEKAELVVSGGVLARDDSWGGSNMVGGSPRFSGSKLTPDQVTKVIEDYLNDQ